MIPSNFESRLGGSPATNINFNFNFGSNFDSPAKLGKASDVLTQLLDILNPGANGAGDVFGGSNFDNFVSGDGGCTKPAPVEEPVIEDNGGGLKVDGNKITTAGGYNIEQTGQYNWKITGPDGNETRIEGDPHVFEKDGGKWDFNANSTFVLGDGTKINVTTVPYGDGSNGATVTGKLEVISGNDRVEVTDIDKGTGKIGEVKQDGYAHANSFKGNAFVQGSNAGDWSFQGKEIIGNESGKDNFKVGKELPAGSPQTGGVKPDTTPREFGQMFDRLAMSMLFKSIGNFFNSGSVPQNKLGSNPYAGNNRPSWQGKQQYNQNTHRSNLTNAFNDLSNMFNRLAKLSNLTDHLDTMRQRSKIYA